MFLQALPLIFVLIGLVLYTALAGADFGAGLWQLTAGRGKHAEEIREHAHHSMSPVWEANHVWLIFVLTVFWTAYPRAFESVASTLAVPLFIAGLGIVFRGAAYALRAGADHPREISVIDTIFSISSILTPFALGAAIGALAGERVPVGNAKGHLFSSWLNPTSIAIGVLAVLTGAYLAAVFLAADADSLDEPELERAFRARALGAGLLAGAVALAALLVLDADDSQLYHSLIHGAALIAVILSGVAGLTTLGLVFTHRFQAARFTAAFAVAMVVAGWALARWPLLLPKLTVYQAAAGHDTLVLVVVAVLGGAVLLFPALGLLFRLALTGRFQAEESAPAADVRAPGLNQPRSALARLAVAALIVGAGLLVFADADWAHALGIVCLMLCLAVGTFVIVTQGLLAPAQADAGERSERASRRS